MEKAARTKLRNDLNQQMVTAISNMVVDIYLQTAIDCTTDLDITQGISIQSLPYAGFVNNVVPLSAVVEGNAACVRCIQNVGRMEQIVVQNWTSLAAQGASVRDFPTYEAYLQRLVDDVTGLCGPACKSCVVTNISQALNWSIDVACLADNQVDATFYDTLEESLFQSMVNNKDFLSQMVTALSAVFDQSQVTQEITNIVTDVRTSLEVTNKVDFSTVLASAQNVAVTGGQVSRVSQNNAKTVLVTQVYSSLQHINIIQDSAIDIVQELIDKEASLKDILSTIGHIGKYFIDEMGAAAQAVLMVVISLVAGVMVIWLALAAKDAHQATQMLDNYNNAALILTNAQAKSIEQLREAGEATLEEAEVKMRIAKRGHSGVLS